MQGTALVNSTATRSGHDTRVVVVDDHQMFAEGLGMALGRAEGLEVAGTAGTIDEAVSLVRIHRPEVVVIDYRLPDGTGIEAVEKFRVDVPAVRIVLVTGSVTDHVLREAIETGCHGLLHKGEAISEVVRAVHAAANGDLMLSPGIIDRVRPGTMAGTTTLTSRQREVLVGIARGRTAHELASELSISYHTARNHIRDTLERLDARNQLEGVVTALRQGVISLEEL